MSTTATPRVFDPAIQAVMNDGSAAQDVIDSKEKALEDLNARYQQLQSRLGQTLAQLEDVTRDDQSVAAKLVTTQKQFARLQQLARPGFWLALHKQPWTQDPNSRIPMIWFQPGNTGNTGGGSARIHGAWTITDFPDHREFAIQPANIAPQTDNFIWGLNFFQGDVAFHRYIQVTDFELPDEALPNAMAIETNWEHSRAGFRFNAGIQALLGAGSRWRYFDIASQSWIDTGIPLDRTMFGTGKRIELVSEFLRSDDPAQGMLNVGLTINGVPHAIGKWTKARATTWGPYLQQGFQMDALPSAPAYTVKVWNMEAYWL